MAARPAALTPEPIRWSVAAPVVAVIIYLLPIPAWIVDDFYSRDMYPWLQSVMTTVTNILPFAVLDVLLIGFGVGVAHRLVRLWNVMRQRGLMDALWEGVRRLVRAAAIISILFSWAWGFNYRRLPLESVAPTAAASRLTLDTLKVAFGDAGAVASRLRPLAQGEGRFHSIALELRDPMNVALRSLSRTPLSTPSQPKYSLILSPFFTWAGVTGMMNPFGHESIVLPELLPYERPFVLAHEWAHLAGHGDEAEASAVGWLACMKGGPNLAYSASLYLITETAAALPADQREPLIANLDAGVRADLDAIALRMRRERPAVQRTASRVYDEYLRANRVADGTASYARALTLILAPPFSDALASYTGGR
jgi:hypothetical protein